MNEISAFDLDAHTFHKSKSKMKHDLFYVTIDASSIDYSWRLHWLMIND